MSKLLVGSTLLNQFRVENFIAAGGMATIYRVWDVRRGVPLAMKVLHPELASDPAFIARFQREARALEALSHPHIVPFYGIYKTGNLTFLLEQYIDGPSLDEVLRRAAGAPMSPRDALVYFKALYTSLGYAHAQGIIHCDVKPGNVLVDQGGHIFLTDFGIARYAEGTGTTSAIGTPIYMAPEQIRGERARPETDVYSLGVVMFELLTGRRPFRTEGDYPPEAGVSPSDRLRYAHQYQPPPNPRDFNPALSIPLARAVLQALAKDPQERYPNMQAMAEAIFSAAATRHEALPDRVRLPDDLAGGQPAAWDESESSLPGDAQPPYPYDRWEPSGALDYPVPEGTAPRPLRRAKLLSPQAWVALGAVLIVLVCLLIGFQMVRALAGGWGAQGGLPPVSTSGAPPISATEMPATATVQLTATLALLPTAAATPAEPTPTPLAPTPTVGGQLAEAVAGQFVIVQRESGRDLLFLVDSASGEKQRLQNLSDVTDSWAPQWSPDGRRIAWVASYRGRTHILVMEVASQEWIALSAAEQFERVHSPSWLADGRRVSFWAADSGRNWVVIADAATGEQLERFDLPRYRNLFVWNWSSGGQVAFAQQSNDFYEVVISTAPGAAGLVIQPGTEAYAPAWSRDGQWLAFQGSSSGGESQIWVARADGSDRRQITNSPPGTWSRAPTWSPDGQYIGYVSSQAGSAGADLGELFIVEMASGNFRQVTYTGGLVYDWRPDWRP